MFDPRRHAAALVAVLALSLPASVAASEPSLLAQIEDATPTPTAEAQPPLSEGPPALEEGEEESSGGDEQEQEREPAAGGRDREPLPETGIEAALIALLGMGLIASGSGLRLSLGRDGD